MFYALGECYTIAMLNLKVIIAFAAVVLLVDLDEQKRRERVRRERLHKQLTDEAFRKGVKAGEETMVLREELKRSQSRA